MSNPDIVAIGPAAATGAATPAPGKSDATAAPVSKPSGTRKTTPSTKLDTGSAPAVVPVDPVREVVCPSPNQAIGPVPPGARAEVTAELANLDQQVAEANRRLRSSTNVNDPNFVQNTILGPLASRRTATLDRIAIAIGRFGPKPQGLGQFARCSVS